MYNIKDYIMLEKKLRQAHLDLTEECHIRGTNSTQLRGLLAYYLDTTVPYKEHIDCCHACNNGECSNPKHIYWGTRKENVSDMLSSPTYEEYKKNMSGKKKGNKNPNFGVLPWKNICVTNNQMALDSWKLASYIYDTYYLTNWDIKKYAQGRTYFLKQYNIPYGPYRTMFQYFKNGWVPMDDVSWKEFIN